MIPVSDPDPEAGDIGFAATPKSGVIGLVNTELTDSIGGGPALIVRFPRAQIAVGTIVVTALILGLPWLIVPFMDVTPGLPPWALSLATVLVLALSLGWILVPLLITAVRGGDFALTQTGVLIHTGLSSVYIPWGAISSASTGTTSMAVLFTSPGGAGRGAGYPVLRLSLRGKHRIPGWPWPSAMTPVLLGSSRRRLRVPAWWLQPAQISSIATIMRYLVSHPDERPRIGRTDPGEWLQ